MTDRPFQIDAANLDVGSVEGKVLGRLIDANERRIDEIANNLSETIRQSVADVIGNRMLTEEEVTWTKLAIKREAQSIAFRQAVIQHTTIGLLWAFLSGCAFVVWKLFVSYAESRGWKL